MDQSDGTGTQQIVAERAAIVRSRAAAHHNNRLFFEDKSAIPLTLKTGSIWRNWGKRRKKQKKQF
jgi:hypothetical protein